MTAPVSATANPSATAPTLPGAPAPGPTSALPPPTTDSVQDALAQLYEIMSKLSEGQLETNKAEYVNLQGEHDEEVARRNAELQRAQREAQKGGGIFSKITKNIGIAGFAGLCTFNYALVAADVTAHATGVVKNLKLDVADGVSALAWQSQPELLVADILVRKLNIAPDELKDAINKKLGPILNAGVGDKDVKPLVDRAVQINLLVAGAAASILSAGSATALVVALVGVAMSAGAFVSQQAGGPAWLSIGLGVCGSVLEVGAGLNGGAASFLGGDSATVKAAAEGIAKGVDATNAAIGGADDIVNAGQQKIEDDANEKAQAARNAITKIERMIDDLIDAMQATNDSKKRATGTVQQALQTYNQTNVAMTSGMKA